MAAFDTMMKIEDQVCQLERARAVLEEAENYFDNREAIEALPHYADRVCLLLSVVGGLLFGVVPELRMAVEELNKMSKAEKGGAE